jgi:hypothetical protein
VPEMSIFNLTIDMKSHHKVAEISRRIPQTNPDHHADRLSVL